MTTAQTHRGGAPVGILSDLDSLEAASILYLRLWCDGAEGRDAIGTDLTSALGVDGGARTFRTFDDLCRICMNHGRRPLMRHGLGCNCVGADECCFATFVVTAAEGAREDAMLIATLLVRPDMAPLVTALAADVGLALKQMQLRRARHAARQLN